MTQLFINKNGNDNPIYMEVELPDDWSTTLTIENVYFTKSSEYTYECNIPLKGSVQNQKIFGLRHRRDVAKKGDTFECILKVNNRNVIEKGTAIVTKITDEEITLQLLGGNADVNFRTRLDNTYIDEMELGNAMTAINDFCKKYDVFDFEFADTVDALRYWVTKADKMGMVTKPETAREMYETGLIADTVMRTSDDFPFVMLSAYDTTREKWVNLWSSLKGYTGGGTGYDYNYGCRYKWPQPFKTMQISDGDNYSTISFNDIVYCPQPYLVFIIEQVIKALGFSVELNDIRETPMRNIYFCNTTETVEYKKMLPHWSVNEFLTEVENFFGCIIIFKGTKAYIYNRENYFRQETPIYIKDVNDSNWNCETQQDDLEDISTSNISFDLEDVEKKERFDDTITDVAELIYDNAPKTKLNSLLEPRRHGVIIQSNDGRQWYASGSTESGVEVEALEGNQLRDLDRNSDSTISLKIVPTAYSEKVYAQRLNTDFNFYNAYKIPAPKNLSNPIEETYINIESYIETGEYDKLEEMKRISVALWQGIDSVPRFKTQGTARYPVWSGWTYDYIKCSSEYEPIQSNLLRLVDIKNKNTLGNCFYGAGSTNRFNTKIASDTSIEIEFFDNHEEYDLRKPFIFCGKKYVCHHLEVTLTPKGYVKTKKGTFYLIN